MMIQRYDVTDLSALKKSTSGEFLHMADHKQVVDELLEALISVREQICYICEYDYMCPHRNCSLIQRLTAPIEKHTGKSIDEVLEGRE